MIYLVPQESYFLHGWSVLLHSNSRPFSGNRSSSFFREDYLKNFGVRKGTCLAIRETERPPFVLSQIYFIYRFSEKFVPLCQFILHTFVLNSYVGSIFNGYKHKYLVYSILKIQSIFVIEVYGWVKTGNSYSS